MTKLSRKYLEGNSRWHKQNNLFELPEKVLQFGTGVLLRALPDFIIDQANKQGIFNGRVVMVKSTTYGNLDAYQEQDNLYTVCVRGFSDGQVVEENVVNASLSRVLNANTQWVEILDFAESDTLEVVISNTTEVGIMLVNEKVLDGMPESFPGKLLAILYQRFQAFNGDIDKGLVIVPTELISDNGDKLKKVVLELAGYNNFNADFINWISTANSFCNSLVDRIVPGRPEGEVREKIEKDIPYDDQLLTMAEPYALWAIAGDEKVKKVLSFSEAGAGAFVEPDITKYKELKLRLLNGTHTLSCGLAHLYGISTVKEAMGHKYMSAFISDLLLKELKPSVPFPIVEEEKEAFGLEVLDRFRNPFLEHFWINITLNYTEKIKMRVIPLLFEYFRQNNSVPKRLALGFAAYIRFIKPVYNEDKDYYGEWAGQKYLLKDPKVAEVFEIYQKNVDSDSLIKSFLSHQNFWEKDLTQLPGFESAVLKYFDAIEAGEIEKLLVDL